MAAVVTLREVTADTVRKICALTVRPAQLTSVTPNAISIAQAYFSPSARFRAIYAGEEPVGFIMWRPLNGEGEFYLWRLMIDGAHQREGYGGAALSLLESALRAEGAKRLLLDYRPGENGPGKFYLRLGFRETGAVRADGDYVMEKKFV